MAAATIQARTSGFQAGIARPACAQPRHASPQIARPGDVRTLRTLEYVLGADPAVVRGYAAAIDDAVAIGPLTLADRDRLLKRGERLGLRRFDANLVLAAVEQRHRGPRRVMPRQVDSQVASDPSPRRRFVWPTAAVAIGVQMVILAGAWWLVA